MAQLGNTIINGVMRILGKLFLKDAQITTINGVTVGSSPKFTDTNTTYSSGTGLSLSGTTFNHSNSVTAGTAGTSSATNGSTLAVPYVTYDAQGHITATGTHTHTVSGFSTTDTKNTAGSTDSSSKLFLIGATSQDAYPQTYSQDTAYVGTDGCLYSGGSKVLTGITSSQVTTALGYTPYNSTNPNGYTSNVGTITEIKMNGVSKGTSGAVDLGTVMAATTVTGTLSAGETSIVLSSSAITTNSTIEPFFWADGETEPICYDTITVASGSVTMTFDALENDLKIKIRIS